MADVFVCLITAPADRAEALADALVERRLAACVNRIAGVRSVYRWEGAVCRDDEDLLMVKTTAAGVAALKAALPGLHPYTCPELVALPVVDGSGGYLAWVTAQVDAGRDA